jgi:hypothetical protein
VKKYVFIRSYSKDLPWLRYCLRSCTKFLTGHDAVVVTVPQAEVALFRAAGVEVVGCTDFKPGYLAQQSTKLHADLYIRGIAPDDWIIYIDSDCVWTETLHVESLFDSDGAPVALYAPFSILGKASPWQPSTEAALGFPCPHETLRRHGAIVSPAELKRLRAWFISARGISLDAYIRKEGAAGRNLAEFCILGSWLWHFHKDSRAWYMAGGESKEHGKPGGDVPHLPLRQYWSYSGVTNEIASELDKLLQ